MSEAIRWGILGTGWIADLFTKDLLMAGHKVTAVGSRTAAGAQRFATQFGIARAHASYEALAADPEVDIIYIATPHPMHATNAKTALLGGKHVLIEKPFTLNGDEAQQVVELAASRGLVALEAMWTRFLPHMVRVREILASGVLGPIRSVSAFHVQDLPDDPAHRLNAPELGGGALLDLGIYPISFTWEVLGQPSSIQASARFRETGVDSQIATIFGYASGALAVTLSASEPPARIPRPSSAPRATFRLIIPGIRRPRSGFTVTRPKSSKPSTRASPVAACNSRRPRPSA